MCGILVYHFLIIAIERFCDMMVRTRGRALCLESCAQSPPFHGTLFRLSLHKSIYEMYIASEVTRPASEASRWRQCECGAIICPECEPTPTISVSAQGAYAGAPINGVPVDLPDPPGVGDTDLCLADVLLTMQI